MVEKVFISPNRVRAYGNIMNMKTGDDFTLVNSELTVTTDTVDGAEMTVFQFGVEGGISIALVSSSSTCYVGDNVLLTATVLEDSAPVEAAEVTFKLGDTVLGTDETDANGVATYTYATSSVGSFSFSASYQTSTSNSVSVSVNHSYSLAFSQATYTASGGSATLECTLLEDNVAKTGASITVTGTDSSTYTATTNNSGVASVTVTGINASTAFTATYQGATATCTVTVQTYLFYDACDSATTLSNYESSITLRNSGSSAMTQNGTKHQLTITNQGQSFIEIPALEGVTDSFKMIIHSQSSNHCGIGLCLYIDANNWYTIGDTSEKIWTYQKVNGTFSYTEGSATPSYIGAELIQECIYDSQTHKMTLNRYDSNMVFIQSKEFSVPSTITNPHWGVATDWYKNAYVLLEKIEVESL